MTPAERLLQLLILIAPTIGVGTVFFRFVEGWSWIDAYFFSVITLSTVGYGSLVPATEAGKIGATVFIFFGLGIFAYVIQQFGKMSAEKQAAHSEWLIARLGHHKAHHEPHADNADTQPDHDHHPPAANQ
ncbi:MAG: two pore domain potassium channel family protein [Rhodobacteraceae bacterium]|nr:two pore domain potassium channel family protein [Paracoccaceae bacterium]